MKIIKSALSAFVAILLLGFAAFFSPSKPLSIVKDIGQLPVDATVDGQSSIVFKGHLYFFRNTQQTGEELWQIDTYNNVNLAFETIEGRDSATTKTLFESNGILYLIFQKPDDYSSLIYYLEAPGGEFVEIDPNMYIDKYRLESFNDKYFSLSGDNTIIEFDGANTKYHTIVADNWSSSLEDYTYFNEEIFYSYSDNSVRELRKITGETDVTVYTSSHVISFLFATVDGIYFVENNYDTSPNSYDLSLLKDNQVFRLQSFSQVDFGNSKVVGERLIFDGTTVGSEIRQLWEFKGTEQKQITNYQEKNFLRIEDITGDRQGLYFFEAGPDGDKIKYHDGVNLNDVSFNYDSLGLEHILKLNDSLLIVGTEYHSDGSRKGVSVLNNGIATEVLSGRNISYLELFKVADEIYALTSINTAEIELYRIDTVNNTAELETTFSGQYASHVAIDSVNQRIYLKYRAPGEFKSPLSVLEGGSVQKLYVTNATGNSHPRNYTGVNDKTYFIAEHDEFGDTVWESDGYDAKLVEIASNQNPNLRPDKLFNVDGYLVFTVKSDNTGRSQFYISRNGIPERISNNSFNSFETSLINEGSRLYMVAGFDGSSGNKIFSVSPDKVELVDELEFVSTDLEFIKTPHGIFFTTGYDEYTKVWQIDNLSLLEINKNQVAFTASHDREILWDDSSIYVKECVDEYNTALYKNNIDSGLESIDLGELSGKRCTNIWFYQLDDEVVISLIDHSSSTMGIWVLNGGRVVKIDSFGLPFNSEFVAQDSRLYFNARVPGEHRTQLHVYEDRNVKNLNIGETDNLKVAKESQESNTDWLIYKEAYRNEGYRLYKYNGSGLSVHNSISDNYRDIYKVSRIDDINFLQVGNYDGDNDLIALDSSGDLSYLNSSHEMNFSTSGSYGGNLMRNGHGRWLFLQGCNYIVGCEPYSINLNQLPVADLTTDKNHYVAGYKVHLDGSGSTDPENNILEYNWKLVGYETAKIENNGAIQATIILPLIEEDTDLTVELKIVDDGYDRSVATKTISVQKNHPPEIVISAPTSAVEGSLVELNAEGSSDAEGEELGFQWNILAGESITLDVDNKEATSFTVPDLTKDSEVTIKLSVSDSVGNTSHAEVNILLKKAADTNSSNQSSGGGAAGWFLLLMLLGFAYMRRITIK